MLEESQVKGGKHQYDADVRYQTRPESILEKQKIHAHDDGYHRCNVKDVGYIPCHFNHDVVAARLCDFCNIDG